jgi:hypothetical protein
MTDKKTKPLFYCPECKRPVLNVRCWGCDPEFPDEYWGDCPVHGEVEVDNEIAG